MVISKTGHRESLKKNISTDILTIIMISVCVLVIKSIVHEVFGHGGATLLMGEKITFISTMWLDHTDIDSVLGNKFIIAAGPIANLLLAVVSILLLRSGRLKTPNLILFFWLTIAVNFFHFGSYMAGWFIAPSFDWIKFIEDFTPLWLWKTILTLAGCAFIIMGFHFLTKNWLPLIGTEVSMRKKRIIKITVIPWITFTIVSLSGILFFKTDHKMMMIMGAFGNTAFFLIWILFLRLWKFKIKETEHSIAIPLEKNYPWIITGFVLLLFYIFIMGPGIHFT